MFARIALVVCVVSPTLRRVLWRWWYNRLARSVAAAEWTFMNYGWSYAVMPRRILDARDEPDRCCIQLYDRVASAAPLGGLRVLEVGSGRGGGASFVARYLGPAEVIGLDYSAQAVAFCRGRHADVANLSFVEGDAEALPFPEGSFDAVINVESSHCYGSVDRFFREAARVLRPGGHFLFADVRGVEAMPGLELQLAAVGDWEIVAREDLTAGVVAALAADDDRKHRLIAATIPTRRQKLFREFAAMSGTPMFNGFRERRLLYHRYACRKRAQRV